MPLRDVMLAILEIEQQLSISEPLEVSYPGSIATHLLTPGREALTAKVTFMHWPDAAAEFRLGNNREDLITVQIDCLVNDSSPDSAADIALSFFDKAWAAFDAERPAGRRLNGTVAYLTIRSQRPMFEAIEWAGRGYPGFHLFLDLVLFDEEAD